MAAAVEPPPRGKPGILKRMKSSLDRKNDLLEHYSHSRKWSIKKVREKMREEAVNSGSYVKEGARIPSQAACDLHVQHQPVARFPSVCAPKQASSKSLLSDLEARSRGSWERSQESAASKDQPVGLGISGVAASSSTVEQATNFSVDPVGPRYDHEGKVVQKESHGGWYSDMTVQRLRVNVEQLMMELEGGEVPIKQTDVPRPQREAPPAPSLAPTPEGDEVVERQISVQSSSIICTGSPDSIDPLDWPPQPKKRSQKARMTDFREHLDPGHIRSTVYFEAAESFFHTESSANSTDESMVSLETIFGRKTEPMEKDDIGQNSGHSAQKQPSINAGDGTLPFGIDVDRLEDEDIWWFGVVHGQSPDRSTKEAVQHGQGAEAAPKQPLFANEDSGNVLNDAKGKMRAEFVESSAEIWKLSPLEQLERLSGIDLLEPACSPRQALPTRSKIKFSTKRDARKRQKIASPRRRCQIRQTVDDLFGLESIHWESGANGAERADRNVEEAGIWSGADADKTDGIDAQNLNVLVEESASSSSASGGRLTPDEDEDGLENLPTAPVEGALELAVKLRSCLVCMEDMPPSDFPVLVTESCLHSEDICTECLRQSIDSQIDSEFFDQLKCPMCNFKLDYDAMRTHASAVTFDRYDSMATRHAITALDGWWECPKSGCGAGGIHDEATGPIVHCHGCDYQACYDCEVPWHKDLICAQYQEEQRNAAARKIKKTKEEKEAAKTVETTTKPCPGAGCGVRIEKNEGCHHMKCSRCRTQFCWDCLADWQTILRRGNDSHLPKCRWHSKNIQSRPGDENYAAAVARVHNR